MIAEDVVVLSIEKQKWEHVANNDVECVVDSTAPHHIIPTKGLFTMYKVGDFGTLVALGEMPRSHYTFKIFLRVTSFLGHIWIFFCLVMIGLLLFKALNAVKLRLYLRALFHTQLWVALRSVWCTSRIWKTSTKQMHNEAVAASLLLRVGMVPIMNLTIQK